MPNPRVAPPCRTTWFHSWLDHRGRPWLTFGRSGDDIVLKFARLTSFRVNPEQGHIVCEQTKRIPARTVRHLLHNQVIPLVRSTDRLVLHAAGVVLPRGAVALVGRGGAGKSTLAAALARGGHPLLCDDALEVEVDGDTPEARPGSDTLRVWDDTREHLFGRRGQSRPTAHYSRKHALAAASLVPTQVEPAALAGLYLIGDPRERAKEVSVSQLSPREGLLSLLPFAFQLDVQDPRRLRRTTDWLARLVERVPVFLLRYPRRWTALSAVAAVIEHHGLESS